MPVGAIIFGVCVASAVVVVGSAALVVAGVKIRKKYKAFKQHQANPLRFEVKMEPPTHEDYERARLDTQARWKRQHTHFANWTCGGWGTLLCGGPDWPCGICGNIRPKANYNYT